MLLIIFLALIGLLFLFLEFFVTGIILGVFGALFLISSVLFFANAIGSKSLLAVYILALAGAVFCVAMSAIKKMKNILLKNNQQGTRAVFVEAEMIGKEGVVYSDLKPNGRIIVDEKVLPAASIGKYLKKGQKIKVVKGDGMLLLVCPLKGEKDGVYT